MIDGPAGQLEAMLSEPKTSPTACGIVCHPDPTQEGTMYNKVVTAINWAMEQMGWATLRFNYRGVGNSAGDHGQVAGELDDARAVYQWLHERHPQLPLHWAGFSFGAYIAAQLTTEVPTQSLVTAAPVISRGGYQDLNKITCPWLAVVGEEDELVGVDEINDYINQSKQPVELKSFADTTHFFHGQLIPLRESMKAFYVENTH
jgi:hypothetical protein